MTKAAETMDLSAALLRYPTTGFEVIHLFWAIRLNISIWALLPSILRTAIMREKIKPYKQIAKLAGVSDNALTHYLRLYQEGGLDAIRNVNFYRPQSDLEQFKCSIEQYFRDNPVASIAEARAKIEELTGIRRSKTQVGGGSKKAGSAVPQGWIGSHWC